MPRICSTIASAVDDSERLTHVTKPTSEGRACQYSEPSPLLGILRPGKSNLLTIKVDNAAFRLRGTEKDLH